MAQGSEAGLKNVWSRIREFQPAFTPEDDEKDVLEDLRDFLFEKAVIESEEIGSLERLERAAEQWDLLIGEILPGKLDPQGAFIKFRTILKLSYDSLYNELVEKIGDLSLPPGVDAGDVSVQVNDMVMDEEFIQKVVYCDSLNDAMDYADQLQIPSQETANLNSVTAFQDVILDFLKKSNTGQFLAVDPPIFAAEELLLDLREKQRRYHQIAERVKKFCSIKIKILERLELNTKDSWNAYKNYAKITNDCVERTPNFLVAGSTSSGKSTLLNALLGDNILPTSHNAATSVICEVHHSPCSSKAAEIYWKDADEPENVDLSKEEGRERLSACVNSHLKFSGKRASGASLTRESDSKDWEMPQKAKILWPLNFLKHLTLVDSPGVTEETGASVARSFTEEFQEKLASGFLYVLDASRAAEEAAEVGGLLANISDTFPIPGAALFVLNKWDFLVSEQPEEAQQTDFLNKVKRRLSDNWRGFSPDQLVQMNAKLAFKAGRLGVVTKDMQLLCEGIQKTAKRGMHFHLLKCLKPFQLLIDEVFACLTRHMKLTKMSNKERAAFQKSEESNLHRLRSSIENGEIASTVFRVNEELDRTIADVEEELLSKAVVRKVLSGDCRTTDEMLNKALSCSKAFQKFFQWIEEEIDSVVEDIVTREFRGNSGLTTLASKVLNVSTRLAKTGNAGILVASWLGRLKTTMRRAFGAIPGKKQYERRVSEVCENKREKLKKLMHEIVLEKAASVKILKIEIPVQVKELETNWDKEWIDENERYAEYEEALRESECIQQDIACFMLGLDMHEFQADDVKLPESFSKGTFTLAHKLIVSSSARGTASMIAERISPVTAKNLVKITEEARLLKNEFILKYFGSVWLVDKPGVLGLIFEYLPFTFADKIFNPWRVPIFLDKNRRTIVMLTKVLDGLSYLHSTRNIAHGRLAPESISVSANEEIVKIGEVGFSSLSCASDSLLYIAPEVLKRSEFYKSSDVYSLGTLLWASWNGRPPHCKFGVDRTIAKLIGGLSAGAITDVIAELDKSKPSSVSSADNLWQSELRTKWLGLIRTCWNIDVDERPSAESAKQLLTTMDKGLF